MNPQINVGIISSNVDTIQLGERTTAAQQTALYISTNV